MIPRTTALLLIDVQEAFSETGRAGARRNNPQAVPNIARLLAAFWGATARVFHVRHASTAPDSRFTQQVQGTR